MTGSYVFMNQNRLFCASEDSTHQFMENKCLAQRLLGARDLVDASANLYCGFAGQAVGGCPAFRASELVRTLEETASNSWVLKSATDQASKNVLVMSSKKWNRGRWNATAAAAHAANMMAQPTMKVRCKDTKGHDRRSVILQRKYPWSERAAFMFEVKLTVVWGQLGTGIMVIPVGAHDEWEHVQVEFDEHGYLSLGGNKIARPTSEHAGMKVANATRLLRYTVDILRRVAPQLQSYARDVSRLFAADFWRLDAFLSDSSPPHINELTYPSFLHYHASDLKRLRAGYAQVGRTVVRVPASCVESKLESLTGPIPSAAFSFRRVFFGAGPGTDAAVCAPYVRQLGASFVY